MLTDVCDYVHNYFESERHSGTFEVADGGIAGLELFLQNGQRFRILGSALNDGIYTYHSDGQIFDDDGTTGVTLAAEQFTGAIVTMSVPTAFLKIVEDAIAWQSANQAVLDSPYQSESFGGYSYSKSSGSGSNAGGVLGWQDRFRARLNAYRKVS